MVTSSRAARVPATCPHDCPSTCALEVERLDAHTIGRVYGARHHSYTAGVVCSKVMRYAERQHHPERLHWPLRRTRLGRFERISWNNALDEVAERLTQAAQSHGAESVWPYFYAGTMGLVQRDGIERLRHVLKYSRQHSTICSTLADAGWLAGAGAKRGTDPREMADSDLVVIWGGNPAYTQVNVLHHVARARRQRNARLVVVDPYRTATAQHADLHLMVRPGTDAALACAVMHVAFRDGYADRDYLRCYTDAPAALEDHVRSRDPAWAADITGLPIHMIEQFAAEYGSTARSYIRIGFGFSRSRNGAVNVHAVSCLPAVTGAWQHRGGGALYSNEGLYRVDKTLIEGLDVKDPEVRVLDQSRLGPILCGDRTDLGDGPSIRALLIQNTNPAVVCPETLRVREGLSRPDLFVCVHEQFMTETAQLADVVLPATTFLEHDDFYIAGGHSFLQVSKQVVDTTGEARSNHWVICQLAKRLGARHPGFGMSAWELIDVTLQRSGFPDAATVYRNGGHDCALPFVTAHFLDGFETPDRRFRFRADWASLGGAAKNLPGLPDHHPVVDQADAQHPFRLVAAPARTFLNTSFTETPTSRRREGRPTVLIHPEDCRQLAIEDGDAVRLGNRLASVVVHARRFAGVQRGVVVVESIWPNSAYLEGVGVNALVSADPGPPNGGAVFHDTAVWLQAAHGGLR